MRKYGKVEPGFWPWANRKGLSDGARLLALYLLTNPHSNSVGCYYLPDGYLAADLGWDEKTASERFAELSRNRFAYRCEATHYVLIRDLLNHDPPANNNVGKNMAKAIEEIPRDFSYWPDLKEVLKRFAGRFPKGFIDGLPDGLPNGMANPEPEPSPSPGPSDVSGSSDEEPTPSAPSAPAGQEDDSGGRDIPAALCRDRPAVTDGFEAAAADEKALFSYGKSVLGQNGGGLITKLRKMYDYDNRAVADVIRQAAEKQKPREWVGAVLKGDQRAKTPDHILYPPDVYENIR